MAAMIADAVGPWLTELMQWGGIVFPAHLRGYSNSDPDFFVDAVLDALLDPPCESLNRVAELAFTVREGAGPEVGILRLLFAIHNERAMRTPRGQRVRETEARRGGLRVFSREFFDGVVVWAGHSRERPLYAVDLVRSSVGVQFALNEGRFSTGPLSRMLQLRFYVVPPAGAELFGLFLARSEGDQRLQWEQVLAGMNNIYRLVSPCTCTHRRLLYADITLAVPWANWDALWRFIIGAVDADAERDADADADAFIRDCCTGWFSAGSDPYGRSVDAVSPEARARCQLWRLSKGQWFGVYRHANGRVDIGAC